MAGERGCECNRQKGGLWPSAAGKAQLLPCKHQLLLDAALCCHSNNSCHSMLHFPTPQSEQLTPTWMTLVMGLRRDPISRPRPDTMP